MKLHQPRSPSTTSGKGEVRGARAARAVSNADMIDRLGASGRGASSTGLAGATGREGVFGRSSSRLDQRSSVQPVRAPSLSSADAPASTGPAGGTQMPVEADGLHETSKALRRALATVRAQIRDAEDQLAELGPPGDEEPQQTRDERVELEATLTQLRAKASALEATLASVNERLTTLRGE